MSLAARCKRRSKKADYYCLLLRTEMAGATKGIDKHLLRCDIGRGRVDGHLLRCDIGRGRKSFSVSRCDVRGGGDVARSTV